METVKYEYDHFIDVMRQHIRAGVAFRSELATINHKNDKKMSEVKKHYDGIIMKIMKEKEMVEKKLQEQQRTVKDSVEELKTLRDLNVKLKKGDDEMRESCMRLTMAMTRQNEEKRQILKREKLRFEELTASKLAEQKLAHEVERLQSVIEDYEFNQTSLVSQDLVVQHLETIDTLRSEFKQLNDTHKQLIKRYRSLKSVIEAAHIKNYVPVKGAGATAMSLDVESKVAQLADKVITHYSYIYI